MTDYYAAGAIRDKTTWHAKEMLTGGIFTGDVFAEDIVIQAQMDYLMDKRPDLTRLNGVLTPTGKYSLVRGATKWDPEERVLATVSKGYIVPQIMEMAQVAEMLQQPGPKKAKWPIHHICTLKNGEIVIFLLKMGGYEIKKGGEHEVYVLYSCHYDGVTSGRMGTVSIEVVCWNTYRLALQMAKDTPVQLLHRGSGVDYHKLIGKVIMKAEELKAQEQEFMEKASRLAMGKELFADFLEQTFPLPPMPKILRYKGVRESLDESDIELWDGKIGAAEKRHAMQVQRVNALRMETAMNYSRSNDEYPRTARTGYAAFGAVTKTTTHSDSWMDTQMIASVVNAEKLQYVSNATQWLVDAIK